MSPEMMPFKHHLTDRRKSIHISLLPGDQWIPLEMREDALDNVEKASRLPFHGLISRIRSYGAASEVIGNHLEDLGAISVLADRHTRSHFPSDLEFGSGADSDAEASFSVEIARDVRLDVDRVLDRVARARVLRRP